MTNELIEYEYQSRIKDLETQVRGQDKQLQDAAKESADLRRALGWAQRPLKAPRWLAPRKKKHSDHVAIAMAMLSDLHLDERVDPAEMNGRNAYDRAIADFRLQRFFENTIKVTHHYWQGTRYEGIVLEFGGDIFSGVIHGELDRTNDGKGPIESLEYWTPKFVAGISLLANTYGKVHLPCTVGNHPRIRAGGRQQHKRRVVDNMDWALSKRLEAEFRNDERVTFTIPESVDVEFSVYDVDFLLNHGIQNGGNGQAGVFSPIGILKRKKRESYVFDVMTVGHWHQDVFTPEQGFIINGSMKGWDEFALGMGFTPERPSQSLWLVTPEHGITEHAPILVGDRKQEGW